MASKGLKFVPFSRQQKRLLTWWMPGSPHRDKDIVLCEGSVRSGKTTAGLDSFATWSLSSFQDEDFIVASRSVGALERNVVKPLTQILRAKGISYSQKRGDYRVIRIGTNRYHCFGAAHEGSQDVVQGMTAAGAFLDDAALFPQSFIEQAKARCSVDGSKIWMNCNPEGPFHFIKTDYIDKAEETRTLVLHFTMDDNLSLSKAVRERYERMFTGTFYLRFIKGLWVLAEGVIYDMWDEKRHVVGSIPRFKHYAVACDYGTSNPCTFGLYGYNSAEDVMLVSEYYWDSAKERRQKTDAQYGDDFAAWLKGSGVDYYPLKAIYVDPAAASFITELRGRRFTVTPANNDVLDGIRFVAKMLTNGYFRVYQGCKATIKEFSSYCWDPKAQKHGEDKPLKQNDHAMDRDRYFLFSHFGQNKFLKGADLS